MMQSWDFLSDKAMDHVSLQYTLFSTFPESMLPKFTSLILPSWPSVMASSRGKELEESEGALAIGRTATAGRDHLDAAIMSPPPARADGSRETQRCIRSVRKPVVFCHEGACGCR